MKITTTTGLVGFLLTLSALNLSQAEAKTNTNNNPVESQLTIEQRLSQISAIVREQENKLPEAATIDFKTDIVGAWGNGGGRGWADGSGRRGWVNTSGGGGWGNGRGGGWVNGRNWRDGGSFWNRR